MPTPTQTAVHHRWSEIPPEQIGSSIARRFITGDRVTVAKFEFKRAAHVRSHAHESEEMLCATRRNNMARLLACIGAVALSMTISAQAADPASGVWELNLTKSTFVPATHTPRSQTRTYQVKGKQETARHTGVDAQGNPTLIEFTATYDGKDYPLKGYPDWDSIAMKRIDAYTTEFTQSRGGKVTLSGKRVVSKDGKTMTVTAKGTTAKGERVDYQIVLDKR